MTDKRRQRILRDELSRATEEAQAIKLSLCKAYEFFNSTSDPNLTEASIFEINALRARYDYAIRGVKLRMGNMSPPQ